MSENKLFVIVIVIVIAIDHDTIAAFLTLSYLHQGLIVVIIRLHRYM